MGELAELMNVDVNDVADFMASPVELTSKSIYPVKSFGSGIAPFYTNLALWVGGYVLIAIYKLEVDRESGLLWPLAAAGNPGRVPSHHRNRG